MTETLPLPPPLYRQTRSQAPLSFSQEGLWFLQQLDPENNAYNTNSVYRISGGVNPALLEQALNGIVQRHESLRTVYPNEQGKPVQRIQPFEPFALPLFDDSDLEESARQAVLQRQLAELADAPYDLQRGPLIRCALFHLASEEDVLFFGTHHINSDAWSRQVFNNELKQIYAALQSRESPRLPELPVQYADYALWQREWLQTETLKSYTDHWKEILSGDLPVLDLPTDFPRPALQTYRGARLRFLIPPALLSELKAFCQREHITLFQLLLGAYGILLMRHSGQEDIILGCPFANRPLPELENSIGLFVNTLPIRLNLDGNPTVHELLIQVRELMLDAFAWQAAPFEALVSRITPERDLSRTPVFQVAINMRNVPDRNKESAPGLQIDLLTRDDAPAPFDLMLEFDPLDGAWQGSFQYNADLFTENTILHLSAHFQTLLREIVAKADRQISELEMLTPSERQRLLYDWNTSDAEIPQVCVHDLVTRQAQLTPDAPAVVCNSKTLTYAGLEAGANQLAQYLQSQGVAAGSRVGIYLPRSEQSIVVLLAILKAGGAYIPLDITFPPERLAYLLDDAQPTAVVTLARLKSALPQALLTICLDDHASLINACPAKAPDVVIQSDSPIYILYTSGSTGRPKGVINLHRGIVNYIVHTNRQFSLSSSDSMIQLTSLSFDVSVGEIFGPLTSGGTVYMTDDEQMRNPDFINQMLLDKQITVLSMVPTMLRALCASALAAGQGTYALRLLLPAGEALQKADVELARRVYGASLEVFNQYGPTECSIVQINHRVSLNLQEEGESIPIGRPISNVRAYVLDKFLHPVAVGTSGELFIGGAAVGRGYWNQPELTEKSFLPDPFHPGGKMYRTGDVVRQLPDGTICYLGRSDNQVKIRGYRVELGEIEAAIKTFPGVNEAVVALLTKGDERQLAAYVTPVQSAQVDLTQGLRSYLADRLPFYMLPSSITVLPELPLLTNGKIDRRSLPHPEAVHKDTSRIAPRNDTEKRMAILWEEVLGVNPIGIRDNFFELGGHSLLAVRLFTRIEQEFGQSLPLLLLFKESTIEALSAALAERGKMIASGVIAINPSGDERPLYILPAGLNMGPLAYALGASHPVYVLYPYENGKMAYRGSVQETAGIYFRCLTDFDPQGPYNLLGHSADGLFALELARLLMKSGREVSFLGMLDTSLPQSIRQVNQVKRISYHLKKLTTNNLRGMIHYLARSVKRESARWFNLWKDSRQLKKQQDNGQVLEGNRLLVRTYTPEPFPGDVVYFLASARPDYVHAEEKLQKLITGNFQIVPVPGDHWTVLEPPNAAALAAKILAILNHEDSA